ncbi:BTAD domain-containing putative transcriptional regulator [Actinokineospora sp. NBRC 105648]|uniref:BTAD domain-containing putative transcriptional regulator n=1 Tax=Actinokineospora sp. NBRC 105648 TaxID=3032206 RepID=UPI0024A317AE|nr:BTAD domain-containing putative transcriptional regulator [Actinokineospora sp. NBRC 105648]GLZ37783.1 hypothetical protein Acsp05_14080 [Actinokineospora sp. NBRC 105648]
MLGPARAAELLRAGLDLWRGPALVDLPSGTVLAPYLALAHSYDEWLHEQLIVALNADCRRADALETYQKLHRTLDDELGIAPSEPLLRLQFDLLVGTAPPPRPVAAVLPVAGS